MKNLSIKDFNNHYEYKQAKKQIVKSNTVKRNNRKNKTNLWSVNNG